MLYMFHKLDTMRLRMFWDDDESRPFQNDFIWDSYRIIGDFQASFAVPVDADSQLIKRLFAGLKSWTAGLKSIDYTLNQYGKNWKFDQVEKNQELLVIEKYVALSKEILEDFFRRRSKLKDINGSFGLFAAGAALMRLEVTFISMRFLLLRGLSFEAATLLRLILEQIAWAYDVHDKSDKYVNRQSPTKSITSLKKVLPVAGNVYGYLSKKAHIDPSIIRQVVDFPKEGPAVVLSSYMLCIIIGLYLVIISDWYAIITEWIYRDYFQEFKFIEKGDSLSMLKDRFSFTKIKNAYQVYNEYCSQETNDEKV